LATLQFCVCFGAGGVRNEIKLTSGHLKMSRAWRQTTNFVKRRKADFTRKSLWFHCGSQTKLKLLLAATSIKCFWNLTSPVLHPYSHHIPKVTSYLTWGQNMTEIKLF